MDRNLWILVLAATTFSCGGAGGDAAPAAAPATAVSSVTPPSSGDGADETVVPPSQGLSREVFSYTGGNRDPFVSLLTMANAGPELPDLSLVAVYLDQQSSGNSIAVLRERLNGRRYNVRKGDQLGRLRVLSIGRKDVTFIIDDFGTERQETLSLRKLEEETP